VKLVTVVSEWNVDNVIKVIVETAATGNIGDGKIFVSDIEDAIRVRTGERGNDVL
jgi:nitrogen regulatory protein P-II 1